MSKIKKEYKVLIVIILILIIIDQIFKFVVIKNGNITVINGILDFKVMENTDGTYGVNTGSTLTYVLTNLIVVVIAFKFIISENQFVDNKMKIFLSLIIAGGFANTIDRIFRGFVVEYIDFTQFIKIPVFNLADIYVLVGWVCMIAIFTGFTVNEIKNRKKE